MHPSSDPKSATLGRWLWEWTKSVALALAIWLVLRNFLFEAFRIDSGSMQNTMLVGDWLFVNKALYGAEVPLTGHRTWALREPERGDIVVFDSKEEDLMLVKRLIGVPGDTLAMTHGQLYRNGARVDESYVRHIDVTRSAGPSMRAKMRGWQLDHYIGEDTADYYPDLQDWGPLVVPADSFFMMGDNRDDSYDSRYWGFQGREHIRGRPMFVYFSIDRADNDAGLLSAVRWPRLFTRLR